jgi:hypothetical protein
MLIENNLRVKTELAECLCEIIKQFDCLVFAVLDGKGDYIEKVIKVLGEMAKSIRYLRYEYSDLAMNLIWSLGIMNSENPHYGEIFVSNGGINTILAVA